MMQLPAGLVEKHLRSHLCKGDVLFWESFRGKKQTKDSYFVVLSRCINDRFIVVRATSKKELYTGTLAKRLSHDIALIKKGETKIFPKDTILDLNWLHHFTVEELAQLIGGTTLKKKGRLPECLIDKINETVKSSVTVSKHDKKIILQS